MLFSLTFFVFFFLTYFICIGFSSSFEKKKVWKRQNLFRNASHIIHSSSVKLNLSVSKSFEYSLISLKVGMHAYCYCWLHKACRKGLKGCYTAPPLLLLPRSALSFPPFAGKKNLCMQTGSMKNQTHPLNARFSV